ncbi:MAG: polyphosphate kinase 2 family protein [Acidobacteria bacterium]|nr:MAG: polyphosphate kinase 2 family protein [Acidobacteriota bacterium]REJ98691.1 MAG: polyphosphate kinase 2 family protein [Acidobacteriota bacterium]REK17151.1 MAG: polyphosphate kinase 2 family protein [Acidobacteriota bacterium]REK43061.1 MAG: polyphosphate kinase 2 family protein [Acidobacteriota bacterium]
MDVDKFRIKDGSSFDLGDHDAGYTADYLSKDTAVKHMKANIRRLYELQAVLYADNKRSLLIIFQAMDAAGKDGAIKKVMSGLNPQGTQVFSFKKPSQEELDHDYLWRCSKSLPERGRIGIFNRSYYEDVLIVRVHPAILESKNLPDPVKNDPDIWNKRYRQIRDFERHLTENGTKVIKFFLNVSKEEQKERFLSRIDTPHKNWKFSSADARERGFWDRYMEAYTEAIRNTATDESPWYVLPADHKWFTRLAVSEAVAQALESMDLRYPTMTEEHLENLQLAKEMLLKEDGEGSAASQT